MSAVAVASPTRTLCGCGAPVLLVALGGELVAVELGEALAPAEGRIAVDEDGRARRLSRPGLGHPRREGEAVHDVHACRAAARPARMPRVPDAPR